MWLVKGVVAGSRGNYKRKWTGELVWIESPLSKNEKEEEVYQAFREILSAIDRFNESSEHKIRTLGFSPTLLFRDDDLAIAARSIKRAYLEWISQSEKQKQ